MPDTMQTDEHSTAQNFISILLRDILPGKKKEAINLLLQPIDKSFMASCRPILAQGWDRESMCG